MSNRYPGYTPQPRDPAPDPLGFESDETEFDPIAFGNHWNSVYDNSTQHGSNVVDRWWNAEETSNIDFARQMVAQQYQNWWESAPEQMKRLKDAGVNVNFAAGSVAGSSAGAAPMSAPQTDTNMPLGEIASLVNAASGGVANVAGAVKDVADTKEVVEMLPWKKVSLQTDTLLSLENVGLTRAQAQAINIANFYKPVELQLGIAQMRLGLPILVQQEKVLRGQYEKELSDIDYNEQMMKESEANIDLMSKRGFNEEMQARRAAAEARYISQRFQLLKEMNWDASTGLEGLFGTYLANPKYSVDDLEDLSNNLTNYAYLMSKFKFLGDNNLPLDEGRSLFEVNTDAEVDKSYRVRKDIPASVKVGPFETSTQLRDFFHEGNNKTKDRNRHLYSQPYRK